MRVVLSLLFAATLCLTGCVEDDPDCPDADEEIACTCSDGSQGVLVCADDTAQCHCDGDEGEGEG